MAKKFFSSNYGSPLMRVDNSGIQQAGEAYGQMFANLGKTIGSTIEKFREGKEKKEQQQRSEDLFLRLYETNSDNPIFSALSIQSTEEAKAVAKDISKDPKLVADAMKFAQMQMDQQKRDQANELFDRTIAADERKIADRQREVNFDRFLGQPGKPMVDPSGPDRNSVLRNLQAGKGATPPARMIPGPSPAEGMLISQEAKNFMRQVVEAGQPVSEALPMAQKLDSQIAAQTLKPYSPTELKALRELEKPNLNPGEVEIDKLVAKEYSEFVNMGGQAAVNSKIKKLDDAIVELEKDGDLTGWIKGSLPESLKALFNSKGLSTKEAVESVIQENLRETLGAQFAQKEGEMFMARGYNDKLGDVENTKRVRALLKEIKDRAKARNQSFAYFKDNGTMKGYNGPSFEKVESQSPDTGGIETSTQGNYKIGDLSVGGYKPGQ